MSDLFRRALRAVAPPAAALLLVGSGAAAQQATLTGRVLDADSRNPVQGAVVRPVYLGSAPAGDPGAYATDPEGRFTIPGLQSGLYDVQVEHLGYGTRSDTLRFAFGERVEIEFLLSSRPIDVAGIEVVGRSRRTEAELAMGTRHDGMTSAEVAAVQARVTDMGDLLRAGSVPGMTVQSDRNNSGQLCIETTRHRTRSPRGCNMVAVVIDDVLVADGQTALATLNPRDVDRWEMLSSMEAGTQYGELAGYGVLRIYTKSGAVPQRGSGVVIATWVVSLAFQSMGPSTLYDGVVRVEHEGGVSGLSYNEHAERTSGLEVSVMWNTRSVGLLGVTAFRTRGSSIGTYDIGPEPRVVDRDFDTLGGDLTLTVPFLGNARWHGLLGFGPSFVWRQLALEGHPDEFADPDGDSPPPPVRWSDRTWFSPGGIVSLDFTRQLGRHGGAFAGLAFRALFGGAGDDWAAGDEDDVLDSTGNEITVTYDSGIATSFSLRAGFRWYP